jgi:hypothetical protein
VGVGFAKVERRERVREKREEMCLVVILSML